jgi:hypothetical protein
MMETQTGTPLPHGLNLTHEAPKYPRHSSLGPSYAFPLPPGDPRGIPAGRKAKTREEVFLLPKTARDPYAIIDALKEIKSPLPYVKVKEILEVVADDHASWIRN